MMNITKRLIIYTAVLFGVFGLASLVNFASALEYTSSANIKFILNPTLTISTDGDMLMTVAPGNKVLSENYITVSTNNPTGYTLTADVGCTSGTDCYNNTSLSNGTSGFAIVSSTAALSPNTWGHTTDDSATTSSNFSPLPLHDTTPLVLNQTSDASGTGVSPYDGTDTTPFLVGAYASSTMLAGTYKNTVNFYAVANPMPNYMQEMDLTTLNELMPNVDDYAILLDKRDDTPYTVAKLADGNYWMLDNLAIDLINTPLATLKGLTNASDTSLEYLKGVQSRDPNTDASGNYATAGVSDVWTSSAQNYYSIPMVNMSNVSNTGSTSNQWGNGSHKYGGYYNYCAATAGSYCYGNGTSYGTPVGNATEDICPAGWRMPTGTSGAGEYWQLCSAIRGSNCATSGSQSMPASSPTSLQYKLSTPLSGDFSSGTVYSGNGYFWSSTRNSDYNMHTLFVDSSRVYPQNNFIRYLGFSVRCLFK